MPRADFRFRETRRKLSTCREGSDDDLSLTFNHFDDANGACSEFNVVTSGETKGSVNSSEVFFRKTLPDRRLNVGDSKSMERRSQKKRTSSLPRSSTRKRQEGTWYELYIFHWNNPSMRRRLTNAITAHVWTLSLDIKYVSIVQFYDLRRSS